MYLIVVLSSIVNHIKHPKQLPGLIVALLLAMGALGVISGLKYIPFPLFGLLYSWIYLRFFQVRSGSSKGDFSEGFAFATFFPEILQFSTFLILLDD